MKQRMITRTVAVTVANIILANYESELFEEETFNLTGKYSDEKSILSAINELYIPIPAVVPLKVKSYTHKLVQYGMPEETFIKNATLIKPVIDLEQED